jgi:hypothetical protein
VAAGVDVEESEAELYAPFQLIDKRGVRPVKRPLVGIAEVYQVAVVGENLLCRKAVLTQRRFKPFYRIGRRGRRGPLPLVLGEHD